MKKAQVMEKLKEQKIDFRIVYGGDVAIEMNPHNEEKVCDLMDELHAHEDAEGYALECEDGLIYTEIY